MIRRRLLAAASLLALSGSVAVPARAAVGPPPPPLMLVGAGPISTSGGQASSLLTLTNNALISDLVAQGALVFLAKDGRVVATLCTPYTWVNLHQTVQLRVSGPVPSYDHTAVVVWPADDYGKRFTCP